MCLSNGYDYFFLAGLPFALVAVLALAGAALAGAFLTGFAGAAF
jgi:hypothetical protein